MRVCMLGFCWVLSSQQALHISFLAFSRICSHTRSHGALAARKLVAFRSDNVLKLCLPHTPPYAHYRPLHFPLRLLRPAPEGFATLDGPSLDRIRLKTPTEGVAEKFPPESYQQMSHAKCGSLEELSRSQFAICSADCMKLQRKQ